MQTNYSVETNTLMTLSLLKSHGIRNIIISPGGTNVCFATSVQNDSFFNLYSCVDERSAAYMACGLAEETGEVVVLCCTGATASRNYVPALTEAYYRCLPILVITTSQFEGKVGHLFPQVTDRWQQMNDIVRYSTHIPCKIPDWENRWQANVEINKAILALTKDGGGPAHINLTTESSIDFSVTSLPDERTIKQITMEDRLPELNGGIAVYVGNHKIWDEKLTQSVGDFCDRYNAVVLCDNTSNYHGKNKVNACIVATQAQYTSPLIDFDVLIHIGDVSGSYMNLQPKKVWRVNPDGEIRDTFYKLEYVFEMSEIMFFDEYNRMRNDTVSNNSFFEEWRKECNFLRGELSELPYSNAWLAQTSANLLPEGSEVHFGILNSLRSWNYFEISDSINCFCNTGGFGIDGCVSSLIGASLVDRNKIYFGIVGDLAFFYDLNSLGNRHIGPNVRLIVVNNGCGAEFHIPACVTKKAGIEKDQINQYTSAWGHYGTKSQALVCHYAQDLGFDYIPIKSKKDYLNSLNKIMDPTIGEKPLLMEVFTNVDDDADAIRILTTLVKSTKGVAKELAKQLLGAKNMQKLKSSLKK